MKSAIFQRRPVLAAIPAGMAIGVLARLLKWLVAEIGRVATLRFDSEHHNWWLALLGIAAIVLTGVVVRKVVRIPLEHATDRIRAQLHAGNSRQRLRLIFAPIATCALTLGLGGSAGAEGPIAYSGSALASNLARRLGMNERQRLVFLACGAGAGIAAIFKAPLGGIFFTIEVVGFAMAVPELLMLSVMCLTSGLTAYAIGGFTPDVTFTSMTALDARSYAVAAAMGLWCGLYSRFYLATGHFTARYLEAIRKPRARNLAAGLTLGVLLFAFPSLYGEGYGVLAEVLNDHAAVVADGALTHDMLLCFAGILLVKGVATYATNSGGGVAGEFAPTIFAGGMAGALFALCTRVPFADAVLFGMAGGMAGVVRAPLMALFIVVEMTQCPSMLLPLGITCGISYMVSKFVKFSVLKN